MKIKVKDLNKRKRRIMAIGTRKILAALLLVAMNWQGLAAVGMSSSEFLDKETSLENLLNAGTLDLVLDQTQAFAPDNLDKNQTAASVVAAGNNGSLPASHKIRTELVSGDENFCNAVIIETDQDSYHYSHALVGFQTEVRPIGANGAAVWNFTAYSQADLTEATACVFKFIYESYLVDPVLGFADTEEVENILAFRPSNACEASDVHLDGSFDAAHWIEKANDGGDVKGSFVFPAGVTGLELGPTEIKGDLTFNGNNTATLKGPIYVHGNLTINGGTSITTDPIFGNKYAVIIVDGTITIADDVRFNSASGGAVLLVSRKDFGTVINVADGTDTTSGDLDRLVLFATQGNIEIGANRTLVDAVVATPEASGDTGWHSPTANNGGSWDNESNAYVSDDARAGADNNNDIVQYYGFGFLVPEDAVISGIIVKIEGYRTSTSFPRQAVIDLSWDNGLHFTTGDGDKITDMPGVSAASEGYREFGNESDLWGRSWAASEFANFRAKLDATEASENLYVDHLQARVFYSTVQTIAWGSGSGKSGSVPLQGICGPAFATGTDNIFINEFVPNVTDTGILATLFFDNFGDGASDTTFNEAPAWSEGGYYRTEKRAPTATGDDIASPDGGRFAAIVGTQDSFDGADGYICQTINATGYSNVQLSYYWKGDNNSRDSYDYGKVEYKSGSASCDGGGGWTNLKTYQMRDGISWNYEAPYGNSGFNDTTFTLRFRAQNSNNSEDFRIDAVKVTGELPLGTYNTPYIPPTASAADVGGDNNGFENSPQNAYTNGSGSASNINGPGDRHRFYNYNFTIPNFSGIIIEGIKVRLDGWRDSGTPAAHYDVDLSWDGGSNWTTTKSTADLTTSEQTLYIGNETDDWGHDWTAVEIASLRVRVTSVSSSSNRDFYLDWIPVAVTYRVASDAGNPGGMLDGEWVELYNGTENDMPLSGWLLKDGDGHELPITKDNVANSIDPNTPTIEKKGYLVIYRDGNPDFDLDNSSDKLSLWDTTGQVDEYKDGAAYNFPGGVPEGKSFARIPDGSSNWIDPDATPGEPNDMFVVPYVPEPEEEPQIEEEIIEEPAAEELEPQTAETFETGGGEIDGQTGVQSGAPEAAPVDNETVGNEGTRAEIAEDEITGGESGDDTQATDEENETGDTGNENAQQEETEETTEEEGETRDDAGEIDSETPADESADDPFDELAGEEAGTEETGEGTQTETTETPVTESPADDPADIPSDNPVADQPAAPPQESEPADMPAAGPATSGGSDGAGDDGAGAE